VDGGWQKMACGPRGAKKKKIGAKVKEKTKTRASIPTATSVEFIRKRHKRNLWRSLV
jgi:hypothetical protein